MVCVIWLLDGTDINVQTGDIKNSFKRQMLYINGKCGPRIGRPLT